MTRLEWFQTFPEPWKSQAIVNCSAQSGEETLSQNVNNGPTQSGFLWADSPEGMSYWRKFFNAINRAMADKRRAKRGTPL